MGVVWGPCGDLEGFRGAIMEDQMEKVMEHEMEGRVMYVF